MEIFKLVGSIMVDSAEAQKSISKTGGEAEGMAGKLANGIKTAGKWAAGVAAAAVAVGAAMVKAAKDTAAEMDVVDKASQRMKISAESYQELAHAAELSGVEMSTLEQAAKKLEGTGLNMDDALEQIYLLNTAEERAAKAAELFGEKVAYNMTPMLNASAEEMEAMKDEAHELGLVMSDDAVKNGAAMNDMFSKIESSLGALMNGLMSEFMPYIMEILDWLIEEIPVIRDTIKNVLDFIMPIVKPVLEAVMSLFSAFFSLINGDAQGFAEGLKNVFKNLATAFLTLGKTIMEALWNGLKAIWGSITGWVSDKINALLDKFRGIGQTVAGWFSHAGGLVSVPYDNYPAMLHRGETVLNANDSAELVNLLKSGGAGNTSNQPIYITVQSVLDGKVIGESVATYNRQKARAFG